MGQLLRRIITTSVRWAEEGTFLIMFEWITFRVRVQSSPETVSGDNSGRRTTVVTLFSKGTTDDEDGKCQIRRFTAGEREGRRREAWH